MSSQRVRSLLQAVYSGDRNSVNAQLAAGADVNGTNDRGQTALILAVISGQNHLVPPLLSAGANPLLADSSGLNAIEWAERKGRTDLAELFANKTPANEPSKGKLVQPRAERARDKPAELQRDQQLSDDEKSRKWLAGLKQRLDEQAERELMKSQVAPSDTEALISDDPQIAYKGKPSRNPQKGDNEVQRTGPPPSAAITPAPVPRTTRASSTRKRCPKCNTVYNSDLLSYCAYHVVPLVDAEEPIITPPARSSDAILWILVLITVSAAAVGGIFLSRQLFKSPAQVASAPQAPNLRKGIPVVNSELAGKAITLPDAEVPLKTGGQPATIIVRIKVDKSGRVYSAMTSSGDRVLREAAVDAAKRSTFAVTKLGNRSVEGAITYTFN